MAIPSEIPARPLNNPLTPADYQAMQRAAELLVYYGDAVARATSVGLDVSSHVAAHEGFSTAHAKIMALYPNPSAPIQQE